MILNVQKECLEEVKTLQGISSYASKEDVCKLKERIHTLLNISEQCQNMLHLAFPKKIRLLLSNNLILWWKTPI